MFAIFCKRLQISVTNRGSIAVTESIFPLSFRKKPFCASYFFSSSSFPDVLDEKNKKFTESYLVQSCGLSLEGAALASKWVCLETPERPDLVLNFFKNHGFSDAQISRVIRGNPQLLRVDVENIILPKLKFFSSMGFSDTERAKIISSCPRALVRSLKNHLLPFYDFLKGTHGTDEKVVTTLKRWPWLLCQDVEKNLVPNLRLLTEIGVPQRSISFLLTSWPGLAFVAHLKFDKIVQEVKDMGFDPFLIVFIQAIHVLGGMKKANLEYKFKVYERWGWSKDQTLLAFKRRPEIMKLSEDKIKRVMDFVINKMGCPSTDIARDPGILLFSLEKRIIPRYSVLQILLSKGLIKKQLSLNTISNLGVKDFLERYIIKFQKECPQLLNVYQGAQIFGMKELDSISVDETIEALDI